MKSAASIIATSFLLALAGCTATCLRDSDCIGASVCLQDRCVLLTTARDDGGSTPITSPTPTPPRSPSPTPTPTSTPTPTPASGDAGSGEVGSAATATRGFLDAAMDSASPAPGP